MPIQIEKFGFEINGLRHISGRECLEICREEGVLLDVRPEYELTSLFDLEQVYYLPYDEINERYSELPGDVFLVIADAVGLRSKETAIFLQEKGFRKILHLSGGIVDWERDGLPVSIDKTKRLSGSCVCQLKRRERKAK
jgi:rhodanese-related sulfurtransferase